MDYDEIMSQLRSMGSAENLAGMQRYGIVPQNGYGAPMPAIRGLDKAVGKDHDLALRLWASGVHDARILACLVDDPNKVGERQMEDWVGQFYSWDLCDQCCFNLFDKTPCAYRKAKEWSTRGGEYVRRAAFSLMAGLAVHDKKKDDAAFIEFLPLLEAASTDERNYVKKAVNWALRQMGKRNEALNRKTVEAARRIAELDSKSARWIASDALRELEGEKVQERLRKKGK